MSEFLSGGVCQKEGGGENCSTEATVECECSRFTEFSFTGKRLSGVSHEQGSQELSDKRGQRLSGLQNIRRKDLRHDI